MKRLIIFGALLLAGCKHVDTGQVDYRIADAPPPAIGRNLEPLTKPESNYCSPNIAAPCDPVLPARVVRRYMPHPATGWRAFHSPQVYSIEIEQGVIGSNILERVAFGKQFGSTGEIAILANVFEFATDAEGANVAKFLNGEELTKAADDPSDVELKLVYFSDDVKRRQSLNFSNIPLRQRGIYGGGTVGIQIVVMEVDAQAAPVASLLKTLARFGQQILPVPGEAKDMLFDLGESLLTGSQDDKLLEYRFALSAATTRDDETEVQATFAPGRYVIRRLQDRTKDMEWSKLRLDHNTGRLFTVGAGGLEPVLEDLYLTLNIRRYAEGTKPEFVAMPNWSSFRADLQSAADAKAAPIDEVTAQLTDVLGRMRSSDLKILLAKRWSDATGKLDFYRHRYAADYSDTALGPCRVSPLELERRHDAAERQASDAVRLFLTEYRAALQLKRAAPAGATPGDEFEIGERERLVSEVASAFMPWPDPAAPGKRAPRDKFETAADFESAYVVDGAPDDLVAHALEAARVGATATPSCASLLAD